MSENDDRADYEIDSRRSGPQRPDRRPPPMLQPVSFSPAAADDEPGYPDDAETGDEPDDAELLADLPPMPPKPPGPQPPAGDQAGAGAARDNGTDEEEPPDLEALYNMAKGIMPEHDQVIETMATIHARWRRAWRDTDEFSDEEAFELVRILVASSAGAIRALD